MYRFYVGDDKGSIRALTHSNRPNSEETKFDTPLVLQARTAVQQLSFNGTYLSSAHANGNIRVFSSRDNKLDIVHEWKDTPLQGNQCFVGMHLNEQKLFICSSGGKLSMRHLNNATSLNTISIPTRLRSWRMSQDTNNFVYGGDDVDTSVWDTEMAFSGKESGVADSPVEQKKRKRGEILFSGEIWRAKNVPNDSLGLREPIQINTVCFVSNNTQNSHFQLLSGTQAGDIRHYDTRAARRPVSQWRPLGSTASVKLVQMGLAEHEVFLSDNVSSLVSLDLRNGRVLYCYKGISGTITSIAPGPGIMATTSMDRYCRIHNTFAPGDKIGDRVSERGQILEKLYTTSTPTAVVWDSCVTIHSSTSDSDLVDKDRDEDAVWESMPTVGDELHRKRARLS